MPVTTSYPGIYIEELPSSAHTITAAPTSIAVFIGYAHPFRGRCAEEKKWGEAIRIFNFTEYEREFGGLFKSTLIGSNLPYAVQQFFLNGGSVAYVVGIQPRIHSKHDPKGVDFPAVTMDIQDMTFTGLEPLSRDWSEITVSISATADKADITVSYGSRSEAFRGVSLEKKKDGVSNANYVENRINGVSTLVEVKVKTGTVSFTPTKPGEVVDNPLDKPIPPSDGFVFESSDFTAVFEDDGPLDKVDIFNLMVLPGIADFAILTKALTFCEKKRAFLIMDPPINASADGYQKLEKIEDLVDKLPKSANGALYFPYLTSIDSLTGKPNTLPPSGFVAGIYARTDNNRGVWKAPAGLETSIRNATGVVPTGKLTDMRAGVLNDKAINAIRTFPDAGPVVFGARTLVGSKGNTTNEQWRYVPVRRMALFIEQTLLANLGWVVFEPNDVPLWIAIRSSVERFMLSLFRQQAFQGTTPSQAFLVKCDSSTTTQYDVDLGKVNILVGFRPLKPAEFVIIKIAQLAGQVQA